ncbi:MAG: [protein-PII] uridylyltransferase [Planctomycetaceae bacterium]|nr:[protein-PII] uridylyltransferase [Planctomycetaceae bacterium]
MRGRVHEIRTEARRRFEAGMGSVPVACFLSESFDKLLCDLMERAIEDWSPEQQHEARNLGSIIAVGGTGRGEMAPYSDIDLLFLDRGGTNSTFREAVTRMTRSCWDTGIELGHSVRTIRECVSLAKQDGQIATTMIEARHLWGPDDLTAKLKHTFRARVVKSRMRAFIDGCIAARTEEWGESRPTALELTPDVKKSLGGLRDLHLIRWITFAVCGHPDLESLRLHGLLPQEDVRRLRVAREYLTRIRLNLHFAAGRAQDVLTREDQLRLAEEDGYEASIAQRPVEQFMRHHFEQSSAIAEITRRFLNLQQRRHVLQRAVASFGTHRSDGYLLIRPHEIEVAPRNLSKVTNSIESMLRLFKSAVLYGLPLSAGVIEALKEAVPDEEGPLSTIEATLFRDILSSTSTLGPILRQMFDCRLLDHVIPQVSHIRCLLQFNQYHSYTVDEHTLLAMETITSFEADESPVGSAYQATQRKDVLHLAMLLHDIGKGFEEDHCEVGRRIAEEVAPRLGFSENRTAQIMLLVKRHLEMADLALRKDFTEEKLLVEFVRAVGSQETLRMLYVLTVADITAVGPGVFTKWKSDLLADLFDRAMLLLSGKHYSYLEESRLQEVKRHVANAIDPMDSHQDDASWQRWIEKQLSGFSAYYLTCTPPHRIASDLDVIQHLKPDECRVHGVYDKATKTVDYRVIMHDTPASDCFQRITGVLASMRMEIFSADINTTTDGVVVDNFRVIDRDFSGEVPAHRIHEVATAIQNVLHDEHYPEPVFRRNRRYDPTAQKGPVADLPLRVETDKTSSASRTIVNVFAYDRPGLLYTIARTLHDLDLSVVLAKIDTHFDQVVDVFYVTDLKGGKVEDDQRLLTIRATLHARLEEHRE